jgi:hypothetical protein
MRRQPSLKIPCGVDSDLRRGRKGSLNISLGANHAYGS